MNHAAALRDLTHADPRVRAQAADALGRAADDERAAAEEALLRAADDPHPAVRYAALLSLGELGLDGAVDTVAPHLEDAEPLVREAAAIALGQLGLVGREGAAAAWPPLGAALRSAQPEVRFQAIASLVEIDPARAAPEIAPLVEDGDPKVRAQAIAGLGDARAPEALAAIVAHLDDVDEVRFEAALALSRLRDRRGMAILVAALRHRDRALDAATSLAELGLGDDGAAAATARALLERWLYDPLVKVRLAEALASVGDPKALALLRRLSRHRRDDVRGLAESVLASLTRPSAQ